MVHLGAPELLLLLLLAVAVVWPAMRICAKAGYPALYGLAAAVPLLNVLLLWFLALADWPKREPDR